MKPAIIAAITFGILDAIWLGLVANKFYKDQIGFLLADKPNWPAALLFYAIFIVGLTVFVILPAESASKALLLGAFFGFVTYATYDLTNLATVAKWPVMLTAIDMAWGTVAAGITAFIAKSLTS